MKLAFHLEWVPITIFLVTYGLIAFESNVGLYLDRTATAFCGAVAMVLAGSLTRGAALRAIDWGTIGFLLGMMILVAHFEVSGFFHRVAATMDAWRGRGFSCWRCWCSSQAFFRLFSSTTRSA